MAAIIMTPSAKLRSPMTWRLTTGRLGGQQPADGAGDAEEGEQEHDADEGRAEPVFVLAAIERHLQAAEADGDEAMPI